jgi:hypothetical protein
MIKNNNKRRTINDQPNNLFEICVHEVKHIIITLYTIHLIFCNNNFNKNDNFIVM